MLGAGAGELEPHPADAIIEPSATHSANATAYSRIVLLPWCSRLRAQRGADWQRTAVHPLSNLNDWSRKDRVVTKASVAITTTKSGVAAELRQDLRHFCYYLVTLLASLDGFLRIF